MNVGLLEVWCEKPKVDVESNVLMKGGWMCVSVCLWIVIGAEVGGDVVRIWRSGVFCGDGEMENGPSYSCVVVEIEVPWV